MNTPTVRSAASLPAQQASEVQAQAHGAAGKGEEKTANANANARVPKGPFKIMTIPQAWYNSLHAGPTAGDDTGGERG